MMRGLGPLAAGVAALVSTAGVASGEAVAPVRAIYAFTIRAELGAPQEQGRVDGRRMRFVPITGGSVSGPRLTGAVLAGGGDWQALHDDGLTEVNARYTLKAQDGTVIDVVNAGLRVASPEVAGRLARGEAVDPGQYYFRTTPRFTVAAGPQEWLRRTLFVARGIRRPDHVEIAVFAVE
jgi:outer membrane receptor protein involved in Fe transport